MAKYLYIIYLFQVMLSLKMCSIVYISDKNLYVQNCLLKDTESIKE